MKTCPVCGARCFDDMEVCYGCMHRFDARDTAASAAEAATVFGQCAADVAVRGPARSDGGVRTPAQTPKRAGEISSAGGFGTTALEPSAPADESANASRSAVASAFPGKGSSAMASLSFDEAPASAALPNATSSSTPSSKAASAMPGSGPSVSAPAVAPEPSARQFLQGMSVASPPFALGELERGVGYQIVITLRPVASASAAHGAGTSAGMASM